MSIKSRIREASFYELKLLVYGHNLDPASAAPIEKSRRNQKTKLRLDFEAVYVGIQLFGRLRQRR